MITDDTITMIRYGEDASFYINDSQKSYVYQWLNEDFLDTLYNYENLIVTDARWNSNNTITTASVGLLTVDEYEKSKNTNSYRDTYLGINLYWWVNKNESGSSSAIHIDSDNIPTGGYITAGVRPTVYLQSGLEIRSGTGTSEDPYIISGDKEAAIGNTTLLNTRQSGEYVNFDGELYRIVGIENNTTKLNKIDYVRDESDAVIEKNFSINKTYGSGTSDTYWDYYLNNTWYNSITQNYKNMLVEGTYYLGTTSTSYKGAICATESNTTTTTNCEKTTSTWTGYVGLPRYGEMFASQQGNGYSSSLWLITPNSSSGVWVVHTEGYAYNYSLSSSALGVRPSINLSSLVKITGGTGLKNDPFEISM